MLIFWQLHLIAAKVLDIGKAIMRGHQNESEDHENGLKALDAIKWIQIAFTLVEKTDDVAALGTNELKVYKNSLGPTEHRILNFFCLII